MDRNLIQSQIEEHKRQIELLEKQLNEREMAGQKKIEKVCNEVSTFVQKTQKAIARHNQVAANLQSWLDRLTT